MGFMLLRGYAVNAKTAALLGIFNFYCSLLLKDNYTNKYKAITVFSLHPEAVQ